MKPSAARQSRASRTILAMASVAGLITAACLSSCGTPPQSAPALTVLSDPQAEHDFVISDDRWTYDGADGRVIVTPHYRLCTTMARQARDWRMAEFLERCLIHYTTEITPLPPPSTMMETYLFSTRGQWASLTRTLLGDHDAEPFLKIDRGGFSVRGKGVYHDLGPRDTLVIAAHEGWHQYVQAVFRDSLPTWLDEGLATHMEGFLYEPADPDRPVFKPWANLERYDTLRWAVWSNRLLPLKDLLATSPQKLIANGERAPLFYYAQVWALVHFLREGSPSVRTDGLTRVLKDASEGRLNSRVRAALGDDAAEDFVRSRDGLALFRTYFSEDLATTDREFREFCKAITPRGGRTAIADGKMPKPASPAPQTN